MWHGKSRQANGLPLPYFAVVRFSVFLAICMAHLRDGRYHLGSGYNDEA